MTKNHFYCHICGLKFYFIKLLVYIFILFTVFSSCVDTLPLSNVDGERKLFVVCEMKVGQKLIANVSFLGNTQGVNYEPVLQGDTFNLAISEGDSDFGVPFIFDKSSKGDFFISEGKINLKSGIKYKFRGIGNNSTTFEPIVTIPAIMDIETVFVELTDKKIVNNLTISKIRCVVKLNEKYHPQTYFYILPTTENGNPIGANFEKDFQAYKSLSHRSGFLVDYERVTDSELVFYLETIGTDIPKMIHVEFGNVSPSFYQYNYFKSNATTGLNATSLDPAISGFNINTDLALGSFSAMTSFVNKYPVK